MIGGKTLAYRYARAMADLALVQNRLGEVWCEMMSVKELFESVPDSARILQKPLTPKEKRKFLLSEIMVQLNLSKTVASFLELLFEKNRIGFLDLILESYQEIVDDYLGRVRATVYSTRTLLDAEKNRLQDALKKKFKVTDVVLECQIDDTLIGGLKVKVKSLVFDASLKNQLARIQSQLGEE